MNSHAIRGRNNVLISGTGDRILLFVHGFGCDQSMWRYIVPAFEADYRIVLMDLVGSGQSDLSAFNLDRYSNLEGYAEDIVEVIEALEMSDVTLIGHSVSSMLGVIAAIRNPKAFSRIVMIGPSPCYLNHPPDYLGGFDTEDIEEMLDLMDKNYMGWASFLAPVIMGNPDSPKYAEELEERFCSTDPITAKAFAKATFYSDHRHSLSQVTTPCLIMQCSEDAIAPDSVGEYMHRQMPNAAYVKLKATGHCPHLSHPKETIAVIQNYLKQHYTATLPSEPIPSNVH